MGCPCFKAEEEEAKSPLVNSSSLTEIGPDSFKIIKIIGRGNFGKVCLVEKRGSTEVYAMKILKKKLIEEKGQRIHTITERRILESAKCPFIAKLYYAFQTPNKLYMVMEYLNGGELFFHLANQGAFSEMRTRFYISEILLGLDYLHSQGVIYRDLKPENILLDWEGHIKLTDFGLSKQGIDEKNPKAYTFCGTAEYLAPEVIKGQGYNKKVDFWSLGALMYYMLSGAPPHYSKDKSQIFKDVVNKPIEPLSGVSANANDLMLKLLKINPEEREANTEVIKLHAWFYGIKWEEVYSRKLEAPYRPRVKNSRDTGNFDKAFTNEKVTESFEGNDLSPSPNEFSGFTYKDAGSVKFDIASED